MTDQGKNPEEVPGEEPGTGRGDEFIQAEGPDVETSLSDADQAFLDGVSAGTEAAAPSAQTDEHLEDLRRVTAEYANYRRRVERERVVERERAVGDAARAILPVLDDLDRAEAHGDLAEGGPLTTIAQKLRGAVGKLGLVPFGETGELFDPREHDAIFQRENPAVEKATVSDVVERGYRIGETVLRVAKVVVDTPAS
jgi:molecular chaperone GrpE